MAEIPRTRASLLVRIRDRQDQGAWAEFVAKSLCSTKTLPAVE